MSHERANLNRVKLCGLCGAVLLWLGLVAVALASGDSQATAHKVDQLLTKELYGGEKSSDASADSGKLSSETAPASDDETFVRRASLDLVGEQPSPQRVMAFVLDSSPNKRQKLVEELLADPHYGQNWARYWRDVILYRRSDERVMRGAATLVVFLTEQFNQNTHWDEITRRFITATGEIHEHGETALIMAHAANPEDVTAEVSRIFLGIQIQCAQCHDHRTDRWKREQFHELAAFFPRIVIRPVNTDDVKSFKVEGDDRGVGKRAPGAPENVTAEHYMPDLNDPHAKGTLMKPVFFATGQHLELGKSDHERRETLAGWLTDPKDRYFSEAFVNRLWAELVGHGFDDPVDDMGPDHKPRAPETLKYLAEQFTANHYDIKWLFRTIMATSAYQRQSRSRHELSTQPFVASCPQRLRADQLFNSLVRVLEIDEAALIQQQQGRGGGKKDAGKAAAPAANTTASNNTPNSNGKNQARKQAGKKFLQARKAAGLPSATGKGGPGPLTIINASAEMPAPSDAMMAEEKDSTAAPKKPEEKKKGQQGPGPGPRGPALQTFGFDPSERRDEVAGSIPQALWAMNAPLVNRKIKARPDNMLGRLLKEEKNNEAVVVDLYLRSLAREPKPAELKTCLAHVDSVGNRQEAFEDILWSLLNSTEFLYRK